MANQSNDDVARALAALAGGAVPSEHETPSGGIPSESTVFSPPEEKKEEPAAPLFKLPPQAPSPPAARPRAAAPAPAPVAAARPAPAPASVTRPAPPPAQAAPTPLPPPVAAPAKIRSAAPSRRPAAPGRPAAPTNAAKPAAPPPPAPIATDDSILDEIVEDDEESVIAPAPDMSAFMAKPKAAAKARPAVYENVEFRRTIIPIMLTTALLLIGLGGWSVVNPTGLLGEIGSGIAYAAIGLGVVLLGLAVLNMLHVKHILDSAAAKA